jgi:hypothetical protein
MLLHEREELIAHATLRATGKWMQGMRGRG